MELIDLARIPLRTPYPVAARFLADRTRHPDFQATAASQWTSPMASPSSAYSATNTRQGNIYPSAPSPPAAVIATEPPTNAASPTSCSQAFFDGKLYAAVALAHLPLLV